MDIFKIGSGSELSTPVGALIKSGTDPLLLGPDWSKNLEICDLVSNSKEGPEHAVKAILRRLRESDENTVFLALIVCEACMKNCGNRFVACAHQKQFFDEITVVARGNRGSKNADEALRLIQSWGRLFEHQNRDSFPMFFDRYVQMKSKGFLFPAEENAATNDK
jgi:hypothetical protein